MKSGIRYEINNKPGWASFDTGTGAFEGTPARSDSGASGDIQIVQIRNGQPTAVVARFTIAVLQLAISPPQRISLPLAASTDGKLQIFGAALTRVRVGAVYEMSIGSVVHGTAPYNFEIQNKPSWASFDSRTGRLVGTPTRNDAGTYTNVVISLTAAGRRVDLPPFSIVVLPPPLLSEGSGVAKLRWLAPQKNADGSDLRDLAGYVVYWGGYPTAMRPIMVVNDVRAISQIIYGLPAGANYFAIAAVARDGRHSDLSQIVSKTF